jgi:LysR family glycine cleavage system transcriptional activator
VKLAAEELYVTPGAVSQMLKTLEAHLGVKLFERVPRGIYLTDAGRDYLPSIRNAFRQIAEASRRVAASVDVSCCPGGLVLTAPDRSVHRPISRLPRTATGC